MESKSFIRSMVLLAAVAISVPVFAKPMTKNIPLNHSATVGTSDLKAGDYRFVIDGNHLTVMNGKKVVAEADGRWGRTAPRNTKPSKSFPMPMARCSKFALRGKRAHLYWRSKGRALNRERSNAREAEFFPSFPLPLKSIFIASIDF